MKRRNRPQAHVLEPRSESSHSSWGPGVQIGLLLTLAACATTPGEDYVVRTVGEDSIIIEIPRERIEKVAHDVGGSMGGKDLIYLEGREKPLRGIVLEQSRDALLVELGRGEREPPPRSGERLPQEDAASLKEEIRRDLLALGSLKGRLLDAGKPLQGCKVKVVRLDQERFLELFSTWRPLGKFVTVTDDAGQYTFEELPAGHYKIFWWPSWEDGWIRRIRWEPDVEVEKERTATIAPIESRRRVLR
ncbi:MAG: carboxypeptidase-like regulatory domain-containing protein [Planctomycetota bacterium]|nr:carboxypeptidase-like regulatory domain-containing protein [Planctomycetota bacterium]